MSERFSQLDVDHYNMRQRAKKRPDSGVNVCDEFEGRESELHRQIEDELNRRRWLFFTGSMAHKAKRTPGEPDYEVFGSGGRFWLIEVKIKNAKLRHDQLIVKMLAEMNGHEIHTVRSFEQFLNVIGPS